MWGKIYRQMSGSPTFKFPVMSIITSDLLTLKNRKVWSAESDPEGGFWGISSNPFPCTTLNIKGP